MAAPLSPLSQRPSRLATLIARLAGPVLAPLGRHKSGARSKATGRRAPLPAGRPEPQVAGAGPAVRLEAMSQRPGGIRRRRQGFQIPPSAFESAKVKPRAGSTSGRLFVCGRSPAKGRCHRATGARRPINKWPPRWVPRRADGPAAHPIGAGRPPTLVGHLLPARAKYQSRPHVMTMGADAGHGIRPAALGSRPRPALLELACKLAAPPEPLVAPMIDWPLSTRPLARLLPTPARASRVPFKWGRKSAEEELEGDPAALSSSWALFFPVCTKSEL